MTRWPKTIAFVASSWDKWKPESMLTRATFVQATKSVNLVPGLVICLMKILRLPIVIDKIFVTRVLWCRAELTLARGKSLAARGDLGLSSQSVSPGSLARVKLLDKFEEKSGITLVTRFNQKFEKLLARHKRAQFGTNLVIGAFVAGFWRMVPFAVVTGSELEIIARY